YSYFAFVEDQHTPRMLEQRGNIRGQVLLVLAYSDNQWTTTRTRTDQQIWLLRAADRDGIRAGHAGQCLAYRQFKIVVGHTKVFALNQVRKDFGVGFGEKCVTFALKFYAQFGVILDNPIMHYSQHTSAIEVGMRVRVVGTPVCGPTRVTNTQWTILRTLRFRDRRFQIRDFARATMQGQRAIGGENRDTGGIVAAIFETSERIKQNGSDIGPLRADVANDTAHGGY